MSWMKSYRLHNKYQLFQDPPFDFDIIIRLIFFSPLKADADKKNHFLTTASEIFICNLAIL